MSSSQYLYRAVYGARRAKGNASDQSGRYSWVSCSSVNLLSISFRVSTNGVATLVRSVLITNPMLSQGVPRRSSHRLQENYVSVPWLDAVRDLSPLCQHVATATKARKAHLRPGQSALSHLLQLGFIVPSHASYINPRLASSLGICRWIALLSTHPGKQAPSSSPRLCA